MMPELASLIAGIFGGSGAVLLWELVIRSRVQGRAIAEVVSAEVSLNLEYLTVASMLAKSNKIPADFALATSVFGSLTDRIGDLPSDLVGEVVFLYRYFEDLNRMPSSFGESLREFRSYQPGTENHIACQRELAGGVAVFNQTVVKAIARIQLVQPLLLDAASPWWSFRGRKRRKPIQLDVDALRRKMEKSIVDRNALQADVTNREDASG
jgi:hypothetical protein